MAARTSPGLARRDSVTELAQAATARDFLNAHALQTQHVDCDESVLQDLDTPEDYERGFLKTAANVLCCAVMRVDARSRDDRLDDGRTHPECHAG